MTRHSNHLSIRHRGKAIPYGGVGVLREDGDANHGFKYVKGDDTALRSIPELAHDPDLLELALAINAPQTGLFSIGCVSGQEKSGRGHRTHGYMEFAINSRSAIVDAKSYFPIFLRFDHFLNDVGFSAPASFNWELEGATFVECDDSVGFTCSIFIDTDYSPTRESAAGVWSESLGALGYFLQSVPPDRRDYLYRQ